MYMNIRFDIIKLNNKRHMVPPKMRLILVWLINDNLALQKALNSQTSYINVLVVSKLCGWSLYKKMWLISV